MPEASAGSSKGPLFDPFKEGTDASGEDRDAPGARILRLITAEQLSVREAARRTGKAPSTVRATLGRCRAAGLNWPLPEELGDAGLEERLYGKGGAKPGPARRTEPDWASIHRELKRKHVTLSILWEEYIAQQPDGLRYSRFCELYRTFAAKLPVVMRQTHAAGEKLFVDYAGDTVPVVMDRLTGEWRPAQIFVAVLGASSLSYAEATWTQSLPDWIAAHARALEAIGGVPKLLVPDNTKVAVIKACFYDPQVQRTYAAFAEHYDTGVLPARPRKPRDKAKVESCVLIVERYLLGRLRHRTFYGLAELNQAIREMLADINGHGVRYAALASPASSSSRNWTGRRSSLCPRSLTSIPSGGCGAPGSTIMSRSKTITTAFLTASPKTSLRCA